MNRDELGATERRVSPWRSLVEAVYAPLGADARRDEVGAPVVDAGRMPGPDQPVLAVQIADRPAPLSR